jgi:hypothetical protein
MDYTDARCRMAGTIDLQQYAEVLIFTVTLPPPLSGSAARKTVEWR